MTIDDTARHVVDARNLSRDDLLLASKSLAQRIIDDSQTTDDPSLNGLVYDVWGLYNDGAPRCRWTAPYQNDDLVFTGQFRVADEDTFVVRRKVLAPDELEGIVAKTELLRGA